MRSKILCVVLTTIMILLGSVVPVSAETVNESNVTVSRPVKPVGSISERTPPGWPSFLTTTYFYVTGHWNPT
ncbi:MAG: hypothetical protein P4L49_18865 [Desulfosporosinus sp.]|nr:hypothetical protein [Desulfosporosinus sp.]